MRVRRPAVRWCLAMLWPLSTSVLAAEAPDLENGKEINEVCAGCHGENGQGGKQGEYPRLAGQPTAFLVRQLELFRERERPNLRIKPLNHPLQKALPPDLEPSLVAAAHARCFAARKDHPQRFLHRLNPPLQTCGGVCGPRPAPAQGPHPGSGGDPR